MSYSYGMPGVIIWTMHIIIGLLILYVGYASLNHYGISQILALILIILGAMAMLYHGHLMYIGLR